MWATPLRGSFLARQTCRERKRPGTAAVAAARAPCLPPPSWLRTKEMRAALTACDRRRPDDFCTPRSSSQPVHNPSHCPRGSLLHTWYRYDEHRHFLFKNEPSGSTCSIVRYCGLPGGPYRRCCHRDGGMGRRLSDTAGLLCVAYASSSASCRRIRSIFPLGPSVCER